MLLKIGEPPLNLEMDPEFQVPSDKTNKTLFNIMHELNILVTNAIILIELLSGDTARQGLSRDLCGLELDQKTYLR